MDQREFEIGSRVSYWLLRILQTVFVFVAVTILITLAMGPGPDHLGTFFLAAWSIGVLLMVPFGHRNLATVAIKQSGLEVRRLFRSEVIPWKDVVSVRYSFWRSGPLVLILVRCYGNGSRERLIRVPLQSGALRRDWLVGLKEAFGFTVPAKVVRFIDEVAKHQVPSSSSIGSPQ
jgi:Bacterial PH domain